MKKIFLLFVLTIIACITLIISLSSCTTKKYVQCSDIAIITADSSKVFFINADIGKMIYDGWKKGYFGNETKAYLVNSEKFSTLTKKVIETSPYQFVQCSDVAIITNDTSQIWLLNNEIGNILYSEWFKGKFGIKTKPYIIDNENFDFIVGKIRNISTSTNGRVSTITK